MSLGPLGPEEGSKLKSDCIVFRGNARNYDAQNGLKGIIAACGDEVIVGQFQAFSSVDSNIRRSVMD